MVNNYPAVGAPSTRLAAGSQRWLTGEPAPVRTVLLRCVRELGFEVTNEQFSVLEASRGSKVAGFTLSPTRVPVFLGIRIDRVDTGVCVTVSLEDRWPGSVGRNVGAPAVYTRVFGETLTAIDSVLARLEPKAAEQFGQWWGNISAADAAASQSAAATAARAEAVIAKRTSRLLDGPKAGPSRQIAANAGLTMFAFVAPESYAQFSAEDVDALLTAGQLVAGKPGKLPPNLVVQVQALVSTIEAHLAIARRSPPGSATQLSITTEQVPVVTFLRQQSRLREQLPLRTLQVCDTCRLEKVINPDLVRLKERSRRMKVLTSSFGAVFHAHHVSPYILLGKLVQLKKSDPDFVCVRCQGLEAEETLITFCANCGDRRTETVLRTCPHCNFDFRTLLADETVWHPIVAPPQLETPQLELAAAPEAAVAETVSATVPETVSEDGAEQAESQAQGGSAAGWYTDPWKLADLRYWDGSVWTEHLSAAAPPA